MTQAFLLTGRSLLVSNASRLKEALRAAGPPLLFGLRLWASVSLALYVAFWLELDNPFWAATSAAIVCQPQLGASLRKGWFRLIGTVIGAAMSVTLVACFPQDRILFLGCLTLWAAACAFIATLLRNFASYAAALAGYTVAIIAGDLFGSTGGVDANAAFLLAVTRASEICLGIVCAGVVLASTDLGGAGRRLATQFADLSVEITAGFIRTLAIAGHEFADTQPVRHAYIRRVVALDPVIDQTLGESGRIRYHSPLLQSAVDGLFTALSAWCVVAHYVRVPAGETRQEASAVLDCLPLELRLVSQPDASGRWIGDPVALHRICELTGTATDRAAGRITLAASACRQGGRGLRGYRACTERARVACRRSGRIHYPSRQQTCSGSRLVARADQCGARLRYDWRRCAALDRHRVAGRRQCDDFRDDHRAPARAARGAGLRRRHTLHCRRCRRSGPYGHRRVCGAARTGDREIYRLQLGARRLPGAHGRSAGTGTSNLAGRAVHRDDNVVHTAAATDQPDDLQSRGILQRRRGVRIRRQLCGAVISPAATIVSGFPHTPAARADPARSTPSRDRSQPT